jgi:hypothetical protein
MSPNRLSGARGPHVAALCITLSSRQKASVASLLPDAAIPRKVQDKFSRGVAVHLWSTSIVRFLELAP